jgi:hypothetical protein
MVIKRHLLFKNPKTLVRIIQMLNSKLFKN